MRFSGLFLTVAIGLGASVSTSANAQSARSVNHPSQTALLQNQIRAVDGVWQITFERARVGLGLSEMNLLFEPQTLSHGEFNLRELIASICEDLPRRAFRHEGTSFNSRDLELVWVNFRIPDGDPQTDLHLDEPGLSISLQDGRCQLESVFTIANGFPPTWLDPWQLDSIEARTGSEAMTGNAELFWIQAQFVAEHTSNAELGEFPFEAACEYVIQIMQSEWRERFFDQETAVIVVEARIRRDGWLLDWNTTSGIAFEVTDATCERRRVQ
jgi:hypothetical protein